MKTHIFTKIFKALSLVALTLFLANCSKNNSSGTTTVGTYQYINGICYQNVNGQLIQQSNTALCNSAGQYQLINGICYQNVNGQLIQQSNTALCTSSTGSYQYINGICYQNVNGQLIQQPNTALCSTAGVGGQVCSGMYTDGMRWAQCTPTMAAGQYSYSGNVIVMNCSGYTLYNQSGQIVRCQ